MDQNLELIGSVEFGDWLINECESEAIRTQSSDEAVRHAACLRIGALDQAKSLLLEFLTLQEGMLQSARNHQSDGVNGSRSKRSACSA